MSTIIAVADSRAYAHARGCMDGATGMTYYLDELGKHYNVSGLTVDAAAVEQELAEIMDLVDEHARLVLVENRQTLYYRESASALSVRDQIEQRLRQVLDSRA